MRLLALSISILSLGTWSPAAAAWEHLLEEYGNGQMMSAAQGVDQAGTASLTFGCLIGEGVLHLQVLVADELGVPQQPGNIAFDVASANIVIPGLFVEHARGLLATAASDSAPIADLTREIYAASGPFEVMLADQAYIFDGADYSDAFGAMMDSCA